MEHYDSNLKLLSNYEYEVDDNRIISAFVNNNRLHLIERNLNKKEDVLEKDDEVPQFIGKKIKSA